MPAIRKSLATVRGIERLVYVLQQRFPAELAAIQDPGLVLEPPVNEAYFTTSSNPAEVMYNFPVAVFVSKMTPARAVYHQSGNGVDAAEWSEIRVRVQLVFLPPGGFVGLNRTGRPQVFEESVDFIAERYKGALLETLLKYAENEADIHEIVLTDDDAGPAALTDERDVGQAIVDVLVRQQVLIPQPTFTLA